MTFSFKVSLFSQGIRNILFTFSNFIIGEIFKLNVFRNCLIKRTENNNTKKYQNKHHNN